MRALLALLPLFVTFGCPSEGSRPPPVTPIAPPAEPTDPAPSPNAPAKEEPAPAPEGAVASPIFSEDDCTADADCAPLATCHPDRCVLAAKVGTMPTGMMCTMDCRGGTLDCGFNHCGCAANPQGRKKCAVLPGPKP
jgi:hypothetical protein